MSGNRAGRASRRGGRTAADFDSDVKPNIKKRKVMDKLGSQWTTDDINAFFEAYQEHGAEWAKVAEKLVGRDAEMCETLFSMNKAYLSLPGGVAN
eukprot:CAMPEP_0182867828 /NCGR_PEP_ID=MMETSP0034_2-20130328/8950_1 /TAXON_ID=156128 /ORGANISM="Nephroselmis pyriformis, Strain CCMP717" /LENGTH=94 /DNA_ID=CAMNT_0025000209 /DNA_START=118 /DNA_END=399 /DNA_ORIENTATION=-